MDVFGTMTQITKPYSKNMAMTRAGGGGLKLTQGMNYMIESAQNLNEDFMKVTETAEQHFLGLLQKQREDTSGLNLRIEVANPGIALAEVSITYCAPGEEEATDIPLSFQDFTLFVANNSKLALQDAVIDIKTDALGEQLSIKAPNLKGQVPHLDAPLSERIQYVIDTEINPNLAGHGGRVNLVDLLEESIVVLQFGGGCHGCGMANVTLKQGIEKTLKEKFSEIVEIRDVTDHTTGENPYY